MEHPGTDHPKEPKTPSAQPLSRRIAVVGLAVAVVVALLFAGAVFGRRLVPTDGVDALTGPSPTPAPTPSSSVPPGFTTFVDDETGISLAYPSDWRPLPSNDPQVRFLATPNDKDSVLVRVLRPRFTVTPENLAEARVLTDGIVKSSRGVEMLTEPEQIELGGLPGYFYLYSFKDDQSGLKGAHSHYFLFDGDRMVTLVFQALPAQRFIRLAPTFDAIAASFSASPQI